MEKEFKRTILIRYAELFLKGRNRGFFEKKLLDNIREKLKPYNCEAKKMGNRIFIQNYSSDIEAKLIDEVCKVFGVHSVSPCVMVESSVESILDYINTIKLSEKTFRVSVNRADKRFPQNSTQFSAYLGSAILKNNNGLKYTIKVN